MSLAHTHPTHRAPAARRAAPNPLPLRPGLPNSVVSRLVAARQAATAALPATRPDVARGETNQAVGIAQQKLNVLAITPRPLVIDAEYGPATAAAVGRFKSRHKLGAGGNAIDATVWAKLDELAPGGDLQADGTLSPVAVPGARADPTMQQGPGTIVHPTIQLGATGTAVAELHDKLTRMGHPRPVATSMVDAEAMAFDADTETAVKAFQRAHRLRNDGIVGKRTWGALDRGAPGSMVGRVERTGSQNVRGKEFGSRTIPTVKYSTFLDGTPQAPSMLHVRVRYKLTDDPLNPPPADARPRIFSAIRSVWNSFAAEEEPSLPNARGKVPIEFEPAESDTADREILLSGSVGPSNSGHYFISPGKDIVGLAAHEFGHHIGLGDEYQQSAAAHQRSTAEAAPVGNVTGLVPAVDAARSLHAAIRTGPAGGRERGEAGIASEISSGLRTSTGPLQGAFAQQVATRYRALFGCSPVDDINRNVAQFEDEGSLTNQRRLTQPFLYTNDNLMGGAEAFDVASGHEHDVAPRHLVEFVDIIAMAAGGAWHPARR